MNTKKSQKEAMTQVVKLTALLSRPYDITVSTHPQIWDAIPEDGKRSIEECVAEIASVIESSLPHGSICWEKKLELTLDIANLQVLNSENGWNLVSSCKTRQKMGFVRLFKHMIVLVQKYELTLCLSLTAFTEPGRGCFWALG